MLVYCLQDFFSQINCNFDFFLANLVINLCFNVGSVIPAIITLT